MPFLPRTGWKGFGIKENVDILGESFNEVPALRETCAALEDDAIAPPREDTQGFSHVVILLDNGWPRTAGLKMLRLKLQQKCPTAPQKK